MTHSTKRETITHELKTWPDYFQAVKRGEKRFEVRTSDRDFRVGDTLWLRECCPVDDSYSGDELRVGVTYILNDGAFAIPGVVVMSLVLPDTGEPVAWRVDWPVNGITATHFFDDEAAARTYSTHLDLSDAAHPLPAGHQGTVTPLFAHLPALPVGTRADDAQVQMASQDPGQPGSGSQPGADVDRARLLNKVDAAFDLADGYEDTIDKMVAALTLPNEPDDYNPTPVQRAEDFAATYVRRAPTPPRAVTVSEEMVEAEARRMRGAAMFPRPEEDWEQPGAIHEDNKEMWRGVARESLTAALSPPMGDQGALDEIDIFRIMRDCGSKKTAVMAKAVAQALAALTPHRQES